MEVDEPHKEEPIASKGSNIDVSEGFERSKDDSTAEAAAVASTSVDKPEAESTLAAGGFMREHDMKREEEEQQAKDQQHTTESSTSQEPKDESASTSLLSSSPSKNISTKSRNSLNLVLSPAESDKASESTPNDQQGRRTRSSSDDRGSLQLPRSDPPPTPPTRLASSNVKRRSSRSPNASTTSSSPLSSSTALQNAVTSSPTPTASTSKLDSSPSNAAATTTTAASSSMKRSPSSPAESPAHTSNTDVFGSNVTPNKRLRSSSPSSSPTPDASSSPTAAALQVTNATTQDTSSSSTSTNNTPPSPTSSPLPEVNSASTSKAGTVDPTSSPASVSSSSSSTAPEEEDNSLRHRTPIPRRVKVYALHESNWIDLGTGSCTWHRSVVRRRRKTDQARTSSQEEQKVPPSPPPVRKELSILGRASREAAGQSEPEEEEIVEELVDLDDDCYLEEDEDEAAWIEVVKEGRWKNDTKPAKARQRTESNGSEETASSASEQTNGEASDAKNEEEDDFDRLWTTRIEKPESTASGFEIDSFFVQAGLEEGEEVIGRYRRQQDTLIVWKSSVSDTELALSFAATAGCLEIWEFLKEIHMRWEVQMAFRERNADKDLEESQVTHIMPPSSQQETPKNGLGLDLGRFGQMGLLQDPALGNLVELEKAIKVVARTALGREKLSTFIGRTGFIQKLIPVFKEAEDLESLTDLHTLCVLVHDILNLNDHGLWELILNEDIFYDVISILEYDPAFPNMKASYRAHLSDPSLYVEVVPIPDEGIKTKIHQIYRLQYIKDVILPRVLDDNAFQIVNSIVYFHQVDIVQYLSKKEDFWQEIFEGIFPENKVNGTAESKDSKEPNANGEEHADGHEAKQQDAIAFLQSFAQMVKQLQLNMRTQYFRALSERGMLRVLEYALSNTRLHDIQPIRTAIVEILMLLVDNDPSSIRSFVLKEHEVPGKQRTLMTAVINAFHKEEDLGVKAQLAEAIRVLLLPPGEAAATETAAARTRLDDPNADNFLQYFYENGVAMLLEPLTKQLTAPPTDLSLTKIALYTHLCDLLCFFVINHSFRSKFFILSSSVTVKVATLLRARPKHIRLAALRYFRACIGRNDDFYNRYLVKNNTLPAILELTKQETSHDNLLASACLELFEYLRLNASSRIMLNELMSKHEDEVKALSTGLPVFQGLIAKWEQLNEPPPAVDATSSEADTIADVSKDGLDAPVGHNHRDDRALTAEEEDYFNADDDEEEDSQVANGSPASTTIPLKRSEATADASVDEDNSMRRKRQRVGLPNGTSSPVSELLSLSTEDVSDDVDLREVESHHEEELARIREKRKRAEDEEDDADFLAAKKLSQEKDKENAKAGLASATKTKNVSGKLKLFFGKKP